MVENCNLDYHGGMICRRQYPGKRACVRYGGLHVCLKDIKTAAKRDWLIISDAAFKTAMSEKQ